MCGDEMCGLCVVSESCTGRYTHMNAKESERISEGIDVNIPTDSYSNCSWCGHDRGYVTSDQILMIITACILPTERRQRLRRDRKERREEETRI